MPIFTPPSRMAKNHVWMNFSEWLNYVEEISQVLVQTYAFARIKPPVMMFILLKLLHKNKQPSHKVIKKDKQLDIHDVREALVLCGKPARPVSPELFDNKLTLFIIDYAAQKEIKDVCMNYFIVIVGLLHVYHHTRFKTLTPPP